MQSLYGVLKVVHVLSVVAWIGGAAALGTVTAMLIAGRDRATLARLMPLAQRYGQRVGGPSSILVLLTGGAMVGAGKIPFTALWVLWGLAGIVLHFVFAIAVMRKRGMRFGQLLAAPATDDAQLAEAGRALRSANLIYLFLMASVIVVMVLKPTL